MVIEEWKTDPKVAERAVEEIVPNLSTDGVIPPENLDGLGEGVRVTAPEAKEFDIKEMYTYWKDL